jgi:hypothetical protein
MSLFKKAKDAAGALAGKAGEVLGAGVDKLKTVIDEVSASSPYLREVGYTLSEIELQLSLIPCVILHLLKERDVPDEAFDAVLTNHADRKTLCTVVRLVRQANYVQEKIQLKSRRFKELEVTLSLPPSLRLKYGEQIEPIPEPPAS